MDNVIIANFNGHLHAVTDPLWRYDEGMRLQFKGVDLPAAYQVHFSNEKDGDAIPVYGDETGAEIPYELLEDGYNVYAWVYVTGDGYGRTKCVAQIPVMIKARPSEEEPSPVQQSALDEAINAVNEAAENLESATANIPSEINAALEAAKESGEFDGADGSGVWYTTERISGGEPPFVRRRDLIGRDGATVQVRDLLFAPDVGDEGEPTTLYEITSVGSACALNRLCKMKGTDGEDGTSPSVIITEIEGGHRITITDEAHPQGQSFDVMDGQGGGGGITVDAELSTTSTNPVQNKVVKAALDGKGTYSKPAGGIPKSDMAEDVQTSLSKADTALQQHQSLAAYRTSQAQDEIDLQQNAAIAAKYSKPSGGIPKTDLASAVQTSLGKADTALQTAPVTSVNGQTGAVTLSIPSTASDVGAVASNQGSANANKVLTVNSYGVVVPEDNRFVVTLTPTALDYSGVMDKAVSEIYAAHQTGKKIIFRLILSATTAYETECTARYDAGLTYPSFNAFAVITGPPTGDAIIYLFTGARASDSYDFSISIFPLASGQWTGGSY